MRNLCTAYPLLSVFINREGVGKRCCDRLYDAMIND